MISTEIDERGIATLTWQMQDAPMNILNAASLKAYAEALDAALNDDRVKGIVVTSAREEFIAGADLRDLRRGQLALGRGDL